MHFIDKNADTFDNSIAVIQRSLRGATPVFIPTGQPATAGGGTITAQHCYGIIIHLHVGVHIVYFLFRQLTAVTAEADIVIKILGVLPALDAKI